jgi:hypothetical protein
MIRITPVTKNNLPLFEPLFPREAGYPGDVRLGCVFDDTACGTARLRKLPGGCKLAWLYVAPAFRRRGCGGALLDAVLRVFSSTGKRDLSVFYDARGEDATALDVLFLRTGFELLSERDAIYRLPWESVWNAPFFRRPAAVSRETGTTVGTLRQTPEYYMERFRATGRGRDDLLCADADYAGANPDFSFVSLSAGGIEGIVLLSDFEQNDLWLDLLYARYSRDVQDLLLHAFYAVREAEKTPEAVFFSGGAAAQKLAFKLFGPLDARAVEYRSGLLRAEMCLRKGMRNTI